MGRRTGGVSASASGFRLCVNPSSSSYLGRRLINFFFDESPRRFSRFDDIRIQ